MDLAVIVRSSRGTLLKVFTNSDGLLIYRDDERPWYKESTIDMNK